MIKKILVQYAKHGEYFWDASTPKLEKQAMTAMFKLNCKEGSYSRRDSYDEEDFQLSLNGDYEALERYLYHRSDYEYEMWSIETLKKM